MPLKIISFIFVISLAFGVKDSTQVKDVPFDVNVVINKVSSRGSPTPNPQNLNPSLPTGEFLIDTGIIYTNAPGSQVNPKIAYNGTNYLVVWEDSRNGSGIYGARVTPDGTLLDSIGISIDNGAYVKHLPSVASDGNNYLVVWRDGRINPDYSRIYGSRISQNGEVLDPNGIRISPGNFMEEEPSISFDGTNYLVVWQDNRIGTLWDIYGARVTPTGTVLDTAGFPISVAGSYQWSPSVTFNGNSYFNNNNYLVVWQDCRSGSDIYGARVTPAGITLDTNGILISIAIATSDQQHPYVSSNGIDYLVVWQDNRNGNWDIYGARVKSDGTLLDSAGIPISTVINDQTYPSITFKDNNYMVVWFDGRSGHNEIYGTRITQAGIVLEPNGIEISVSGSRASIAFDDTNYFVASGGRTDDIYMTRITPVGTVLDTGILISTGINSQTTSSVAFDGTNYLIVWADTRNVKEDIYGIRVDQSGNVLDPASIAISTANNSQIYPSVAFDGTNYLVVWQDLRSDTSWDIYGARVSQTGVVLDPGGIAITNLSIGQGWPAVAFDGINYLVIWGIPNSRGIYGARVNQEGVVLDTAGIQINYWEGIFSDVAFGDTNYLVVWEEFGTYPNYYNIKGTRVSPQGIVLGPTITFAVDGQYNPSIAFDGTNFLVTWWDGANIFGALVSQTGTILNHITICGAQNGQSLPSIAFGEINYLVVWQDERNGIYDDIYGTYVEQSGYVYSSFPIYRQSGIQSVPELAHGMSDEFLITYSSWTDSINHHPANIMRIWGKFSSDIGIAEQNPKVKMQSTNLFEVYPNPAKSVMRVRYPWSAEEQTDIKIFDVSGTLVKEEKVTSAQSHKQEIKISLKGINPGIYFLRLGKDTKKFIVAK